jgi:hypothetical protein
MSLIIGRVRFLLVYSYRYNHELVHGNTVFFVKIDFVFQMFFYYLQKWLDAVISFKMRPVLFATEIIQGSIFLRFFYGSIIITKRIIHLYHSSPVVRWLKALHSNSKDLGSNHCKVTYNSSLVGNVALMWRI